LNFEITDYEIICVNLYKLITNTKAMKTKLKRIIYFILIFTLMIFNQTCKKTEATSTEGAADSTATTDSVSAVADSASIAVDSAGTSHVDTIRNTVSGTDETIKDISAPVKDTDITKETADTVQSPNKLSEVQKIDKKKLKANTLIYAPKNMSKGSEYTVIAMVNLNDAKNSIASISRIAGESNSHTIKADDIKIKKNTTVTDKIKVTMKYDEEVFEEICSNDGLVQILDKNQKEISWNWTLKPKKYSSGAHLTFIFQSMDDNRILFEEKKFVDVNISVSNTFGGYLDYLSAKPEYTIPSIILPLITFFAGRFVRRKKDEKTQDPKI